MARGGGGGGLRNFSVDKNFLPNSTRVVLGSTTCQMERGHCFVPRLSHSFVNRNFLDRFGSLKSNECVHVLEGAEGGEGSWKTGTSQKQKKRKVFIERKPGK